MRRFCFTIYFIFVFFTIHGLTQNEVSITVLQKGAQSTKSNLPLITFNYIGQLEFNEDNEIFLADVSDVVSDHDQNLYVCDRKDHCIKVFNANGEYMHTIGKKGKGPGELINPKNITISRDNLIYVSDSNSRISVFKTDGTFLKSYQVIDFGINDMCIAPNNELLFIAPTSTPRHYAEKVTVPCIYILNLTDGKYKKAGQLSFIGRTSNGYQLAPSSLLVSNGKDKIIYATNYPYELKLFNQAGNLVKKLNKTDSIDPAEEIEISQGLKILVPKIDVRGIIALSNTYFMTALVDLGNNFPGIYKTVRSKRKIELSQISIWYDIYNMSAEFIQRIKINNALDMGIVLHCDEKDIVYSFSPEWEIPTIKKYKIVINEE